MCLTEWFSDRKKDSRVTKWYTHVNRNVIDSNRKNGTNNPPVRFQKGKYGKAIYAQEIEFPAGGRVVYDPHGRLLPCGARLVIISEEEPRVVLDPNK